MEPNILFYIHTFPVNETLFWTWIIMGILSVGSFVLTRNLQKVPKGVQHFLEVAVDGIEKLVTNNMGREGKVFVPLIIMIASFVGLANLIGIVPGAYSPTQDLNTTLALAIMVFVVGRVASIVKRGFWTWLKGFFQPFWFMFPINLAGELSQILSHSFRLYGNILGGGILIGILYMMVPYVVPIPLLAWFGVFMGAIQTAVFTLLAVIYISNAIN